MNGFNDSATLFQYTLRTDGLFALEGSLPRETFMPEHVTDLLMFAEFPWRFMPHVSGYSFATLCSLGIAILPRRWGRSYARLWFIFSLLFC